MVLLKYIFAIRYKICDEYSDFEIIALFIIEENTIFRCMVVYRPYSNSTDITKRYAES